MREIDALRLVADNATERLRALVIQRDSDVGMRDVVVGCAASLPGEVLRAVAAANARETAVACAETTKEEAERAVEAALRQWWAQGCREEEIHTCPDCKSLPPHRVCWEDASGMNRWRDTP